MIKWLLIEYRCYHNQKTEDLSEFNKHLRGSLQFTVVLFTRFKLDPEVRNLSLTRCRVFRTPAASATRSINLNMQQYGNVYKEQYLLLLRLIKTLEV